MLLKRLIPCLLFDGKGLVKSVNFKNHKYIGDPINTIKIFNDKEIDEIIFLDIFATKQNRQPNFKKIEEIASEIFVPLTYGGGVKIFDDFARIFHLGVEKISVNTLLYTNPEVVKRVVSNYGSQSIIASVDFKTNILGKQQVYNSILNKKIDILSFCKYLQDDIGVGEILLQDINREGTWKGYNHKFYKEINNQLTIPLIPLGGASSIDDIRQMLYDTGLNSVAMGSMVVYSKKGMGVLINYPNRNEILENNDY